MSQCLEIIVCACFRQKLYVKSRNVDGNLPLFLVQNYFKSIRVCKLDAVYIHNNDMQLFPVKLM